MCDLFGNFLIALQLPKGSILVTYDEDFKKVEEIASQKPEEILKELSPGRNAENSA